MHELEAALAYGNQIDPGIAAGLEWASYHIFYGLRPCDDVLLELMLPVVRGLWRRRRFHSFFFIRYGEGGPHVRLRFLCSPTDRKDIAPTLNLHADEFAGRADLPDSAVRVEESPFEPETQRYGGAGLLGHSLDFFCLTSASVLQWIEHNRNLTKSKHLAFALRALLRQALGFAADENELSRLVAYALNEGWPRCSSLEERAGREFEERREDYLRLLSEEIALAMEPQARSWLDGAMLTDGSQILSQTIRGASDAVRWRILSSQLHMTWNRMGLRNLEEIYLGRILWRTIRYVIDSNDGLRSSLTEALAEPRLQSAERLEALIPECLAQLAQPCTGRMDA